MKYYKLVQNDNIIGIACSDDFIAFSPVIESFLRSDERRGEYISWHGNLYRDTWMAPVQFQVAFIQVDVREISLEDYEIYKHAFDINDIIINESDDEDETQNEVIEEPDDDSLEFVRNSKLAEMSRTCRMTIEAGFDLQLRDETHHFSLDTQDQLNLISLSAMAATQELIPYHADGESCIFYTSEEISQIVETATAFKIYHTTYYNALKGYINALETIEEIAAIEYGIAIPEEYKSDVLKALEE